MAKIVALLSIALLIGVAVAAPAASSASATNSAFNSTPTQVFSVANATDSKTAWPAYAAASGNTAAVPGVQNAVTIFGPGADNTTTWAYGLTLSGLAASTPGTISAVEQRKLNSTILGWGNDTAEMNFIADTQGTLSTAISTLRTPVLAVGNGYLAAVTVATDGKSPATQSVYVNIWTAGTLAPSASQVSIASGIDVASTSTQDYNVNSVWFEDGYVYVCYSSITGAVSQSSTTYTEAAILLQAVAANNGSLLYKTSVSVASPAASLSAYTRAGTGGGQSAVNPRAGPTNYTNSTNVYVAYKASGKTMLVPVARSAGTAGTAVTLTTDGAAPTTATGVQQQWWPVGTIYSNVTNGLLLGYQNTTGNSNPTYAYGLSVAYNGTGTVTDLGFTLSSASGAPTSAWGVVYNNTGYLILAQYPTSATSNNFVYNTYLSNGTAVNTAVTTIASVAGVANLFRDTIGALWFGYASYDTNSVAPYSDYAGYVGRLVYSVFPTTSSSGSIIYLSFSFVIFLFATLFAF